MKNPYFKWLSVFAIYFLFTSCSEEKNTTESEQYAVFDLNPSLTLKSGEQKTLPISIKNQNIKTLQLSVDDSTITLWNNPKNKVEHKLETRNLGVGAHTLYLNIALADGGQYTESMQLVVLSDLIPQKWKPTIKNDYPHSTSSFTQGLEFYNGELFESTGNFGQSFIAKVDLTSGGLKQTVPLDNQYFGEGITLLNGEVFQITWQQNKCFVYSSADLTKLRSYDYNGEGWGLCNNGKSIIMSDGTEKLVFRNPNTFAIERTVQVFNNIGPVMELNELEYLEGKIYANVWRTNTIVVIDAQSGKVIAEINAEELEKVGKGNGDVLNGIAYNSSTKSWFLGGKNWPKLFEVSFDELP
jgi:glutamine cyclotransferase